MTDSTQCSTRPRPRHTVSRGDLLRCLLAAPAQQQQHAASLCGYRRDLVNSDDLAPQPPILPEQATARPAQHATSIKPPAVAPTSRGEFPIWMATHYHVNDDSRTSPDNDIEAWFKLPRLTREELGAAGEMPVPSPLMPWARLWPFLRRTLGVRRAGHRINTTKLIAELVRLRPIRRVPFVSVWGWASQACIIVDSRSQLALFRQDTDELIRRLKRWRGSAGLQVLNVDSRLSLRGCEKISRLGVSPGSLAKPGLTPKRLITLREESDCFAERKATIHGDSVLLLGDMGRLDRNDKLTQDWVRFGRELTKAGVATTALMPCPPERWNRQLAQVWRAVCWDRGYRPSPISNPPEAADNAAAREARHADRLLDSLSPTIRIEPALLRAARLLLDADVGAEFDAWHHADTANTTDAMSLRAESALQRRPAFAQLNDSTKLAMARLIREAHQNWSVWFFFRETLNLTECGVALDDEQIEKAKELQRRFIRTLRDVHQDSALGRDLFVANMQRLDFKRLSSAARKSPEASVAWTLARLVSGLSVSEVPDEIDQATVQRTLRSVIGGDGQPSEWVMRRSGPSIQIVPTAAHASGKELARLSAVVPQFSVASWTQGKPTDDASHEPTALAAGHAARPTPEHITMLSVLPSQDEPIALPTGAAHRVAVRSDMATVQLDLRSPPDWATRFGWDRHGVFAEFEINGVAFPLRWIPPGEFLMGSPEDEPGRWSAEGPQHPVTIQHGFWIGTTPVTQQQYFAVTQQRPSGFKHAGETAPVETVSWDDCRACCDQLSDQLSRQLEELADWSFRLPSEAEWEYACRAGTGTALYSGPLTIKGDNNGPELDEIAWYGGNSQAEYEGAADSSSWSEKQINHKLAGTQPVGTKAPNSWGLYDMLGNVWEWCEATWHDSYAAAPTHGIAWVDSEGCDRVLRGGSWADDARFCRCAFRNRWEPGNRNRYFGFRLVLSSSPEGQSVLSGQPEREGGMGR